MAEAPDITPLRALMRALPGSAVGPYASRIGQGILQALMLPGDVSAGRVDPLSQEGIGRATGLAGMVMGGGSFGGVPRGAIGSAMSDPLYHGSPQAGLGVLNESTRGPLGPGVYTSPIPGVSRRYGETTYELPAKERDIYQGLGSRTDAQYSGWKADKERLVNAAEPDKKQAVADIVDKMHASDGYPAYQRLKQLYGGHEGAQDLFKRAGFEGLSGHVDGPEVLLFGKQPTK